VLTNTDILYLGVNAWDSIAQRPQHLARGLSETNRVLYVDPSAFSVVTRLGLSLRGTGTRRGWRGGIRSLSESLFVFTPPPLLPLSLWSAAANDLNHRIVARMLSPVFERLRFRPGVLWVSSPLHLPLADRVREARVLCYDCLDNFPAFYPEDRRGLLLARQEARLLGRADVVLATESALAERCAARNRNVHRVPNAVHPSFLNPAETPCPPELAALPGPVAGYVGALSHWVDFDLVRDLARARPVWSFVLIGPGPRPRALSGVPNVHCLGPRAHATLPAFLDRFDACLIPFKPSDLTRTVNPVKLYEYLARGKPVVAARTPALEPFAHVCTLVAGGRAEWLEALDEAAREQGRVRETRVRERVRVARENTWPHRTDQVRRILGQGLSDAPCPAGPCHRHVVRHRTTHA